MAGNSRSWKPGESGNPGGRPAVVAEVRDLARKQTLPAIRKLTWLMHHGKPDAVKVQSCVALLDRGWGRPIQAIQTDGVGGLVVNIIRNGDPAAPGEASGDRRVAPHAVAALGDGLPREVLRAARLNQPELFRDDDA
jgi:hypothetical protein